MEVWIKPKFISPPWRHRRCVINLLTVSVCLASMYKFKIVIERSQLFELERIQTLSNAANVVFAILLRVSVDG